MEFICPSFQGRRKHAWPVSPTRCSIHNIVANPHACSGIGERLAVDPNKPSVLFFGARSGNGLWKSTDSGATWAKVSSFPSTGTYVQDPSNEYTADPIVRLCAVVEQLALY